ncbi:MAG: tetratricopeptide repeat protein [Chloroflexi bacterium]|nr:tetratricopeptide repeat protein [Chloroflexota bacterium]
MSEQTWRVAAQPDTDFDDQTWAVERTAWTRHFRNHLEDRLTWAVQYVRQHQHQLHEVASHFASMMALLQQARLQFDSQPAAVELIVTLHPWPVRWGHWVEWEQALRFAIRAAQQSSQADRLAELLEDLASILHYTGRLEEALTICWQAIAVAEQSKDTLYLVSAYGTAATTLKLTGRAPEGIALLNKLEAHEMLQKADRATRLSATAQIKLFQMDFLRAQGRLQEALTCGSEALRCLGQLSTPNQFLSASAQRNCGLVAYAYGHYPQAIEYLQQAQALFNQLGDTFSEALARGNLGLVYWAMGDLNAAETAIRETIQVNERLNAQWRLVKEIGNLAIVHLLRGHLPKALSSVNRHLLLAERIVATNEIKRAIGNRGIIKLHVGLLSEALSDLAEEVAYIIATKGSLEGLVINYANMGRCYSLLGNAALARQFCEQARQLAEQTNADPLRILAFRCLAECQPDRQQSQALLQRAFDLAERLGRRFDVAACLLALAALTTNEAERSRLWQRSAAQLIEMGAEQWLSGCSPASPPHLPLMT